MIEYEDRPIQKKNILISDIMKYPSFRVGKDTICWIGPPVEEEPKLAIATLTFGGWKYTKDLIKSIQDSNIKIPFYLIQVDNNSLDETCRELFKLKAADIHKNCKDFIIINNKKNRGCAAGWNQGINKGFDLGCKYVIEVNNDIKFHPDCIQNLFNTAKKYKDFGFVTAIDAKDNYLNIKLEEEIWEGLCWACFLIKKNIWKTFGGFDERIRMMKGEDYLAHGKLIHDGVKCMSIRNAYVNHVGNATGKAHPNINWAGHLGENINYIDKMNFEMSEEEKDKIAPPKRTIYL